MISKQKPMNVSLTQKMEGMVKQLVKSGRYNSASEVVRDGLRLLEDREQLREMKIRELRRLIQEGLDSGRGIPFDVEDINRRGRARMSARKES